MQGQRDQNGRRRTPPRPPVQGRQPAAPQRPARPLTRPAASVPTAGPLPGQAPQRPPLTKAQKKARDKAIRERVKQKKKQAKQEQKAQQKQEKERRRRQEQIAKQRQRQRKKAAADTPGGLPDGETPRRVTRSEARRRRRRRALITAGLLLVFIITGFVLSVTVLFKIDSYRVEGDCAYTQEQLVEAFGHPVGENMFRFRLGEAEAEMAQKLPYLETVKVRRRLPGTVVFLVTPAVEAYYIESEGSALLLSENLKVLNTAAPAPEGLCRLDGVSASAPVAGKPFAAADETSSELVKTVLGAVRQSGLGQVVSVDFTDPYELSLSYAGRITVGLGTTAQLDYKLEIVKKTLEDPYFTDTTTGALDASDAGKAVFQPG